MLFKLGDRVMDVDFEKGLICDDNVLNKLGEDGLVNGVLGFCLGYYDVMFCFLGGDLWFGLELDFDILNE